MQYLIFQLQGTMASWGEAAVGEYRGTVDTPTASAISGLLCAALGVRREQEAAIQAVHNGYRMAVGVYAMGPVLRDYHTAQVASRSMLKGTRHATRKDELNFRRTELPTILSTRDYFQGVDYLVAMEAAEQAPHPLEDLRAALMNPVFVPYLGRKACPLEVPMAPQLLDADNVMEAMTQYPRGALGLPEAPIKQLVWSDGMTPGVPLTLSTKQRDRLIHRGAWQYGERTQHVAMLQQGG